MALKSNEFAEYVASEFIKWLEEERALLKPGETKVLKGVQLAFSRPADILICHDQPGYIVLNTDGGRDGC